MLTRRGFLFIARADQQDCIAGLIEEDETSSRDWVTEEECLRLNPLIRAGYCVGGAYDPRAHDIDVDAMLQWCLRSAKAKGARVLCRARVDQMRPSKDGWRLSSSNGAIDAQTVVNAAGAWADKVGAMAGAVPIGLVPKRRSAALVAAPDGADVSAAPLTADIEEEFYLKPDAGRLLISLADATPSEPCDARPEELDLAICADRIQRAFHVTIRRFDSSWAGLRSFTADGNPVVGFDPRAPGMYWLAGQGGYGIQSAPALARYASAALLGLPAPEDILAEGLKVADISATRFAKTGA